MLNLAKIFVHVSHTEFYDTALNDCRTPPSEVCSVTILLSLKVVN